MGYYYMCPFCGKLTIKGFNRCSYCGSEMIPQQSKFECDYYREKSFKDHQTTKLWDSYLLEEVKANPLFSEEKRAFARNESKKQLELHAQRWREKCLHQNLPKCPTCGSTNITKISATKRATHGVIFGLFSNTAKSQMQCRNCGYKW